MFTLGPPQTHSRTRPGPAPDPPGRAAATVAAGSFPRPRPCRRGQANFIRLANTHAAVGRGPSPRRPRTLMLENDPLWYKDAIIYELHVRAFHDAAGGGMGDFRGLTRKLDYLQDLGVTAVWLLPFYPSPLKDDGYDTADYTNIHPHYGTLADFQEFLDAAHQHGIRVITELVINHTSDQHPWFQRAR